MRSQASPRTCSLLDAVVTAKLLTEEWLINSMARGPELLVLEDSVRDAAGCQHQLQHQTAGVCSLSAVGEDCPSAAERGCDMLYMTCYVTSRAAII